MAQFLFIVEVPALPEDAHEMNVAPAWLQFSHGAENILKTFADHIQLSSNAWLIPAKNSMPSMAAFDALAYSCRLKYSSLLLPEDAIITSLNFMRIP